MQLAEFSGPVELDQALQQSSQSLMTISQGLDSFPQLFWHKNWPLLEIGLDVWSQ